MSIMKTFVDEQLSKIAIVDIFEEIFTAQGDEQPIKIAASPVNRREVQKMVEMGFGLRILVGMDDLKDFMAVWVGDSNSNTTEGAMHETIASQFGITGPYVPLEKTTVGKIQVTTTGQRFFDDPRQAEDALDRNVEFNKVFGGQSVDYSNVGGW